MHVDFDPQLRPFYTACGVNEPGLRAVARKASSIVPDAVVSTHVVDVTDRAAVQQLPRDVRDAHRSETVNFLFNNGGIVGDRPQRFGELGDPAEHRLEVLGGVVRSGRGRVVLLSLARRPRLMNTIRSGADADCAISNTDVS